MFVNSDFSDLLQLFNDNKVKYLVTEVDFDGLIVPFISKEDLIATKLASGRPQDLIGADTLSYGTDSP
jgi:hypothetical protein